MIEARAAKGAGSELTDEESLKIIAKLSKQGSDSAAIYKEQGREDLWMVELKQVEVYKSYLPERLTGEELTAAVKSIIEKTGASSIKDMGKVMGIATKELAGKADGKDIADKVRTFCVCPGGEVTMEQLTGDFPVKTVNGHSLAKTKTKNSSRLPFN